MAKEATLAKQLVAVEAKRKKLRRDLQLVRMREAGKRRKANNKVLRAVGALLQKQDEKLFEKLAAQAATPRRRKRGRPKKSG